MAELVEIFYFHNSHTACVHKFETAIQIQYLNAVGRVLEHLSIKLRVHKQGVVRGLQLGRLCFGAIGPLSFGNPKPLGRIGFLPLGFQFMGVMHASLRGRYCAVRSEGISGGKQAAKFSNLGL